MYKYKKFYLLLTVLLFSFTACTQTPATEEPAVSADFTDKKWLFYDEVIAEHLCLNLGSDGTYSYNCQCGEPVGDSDIYDSYEYDEETNIITLSSSSDNVTDQIEVLEYNVHHLMVRIDGEVKDFTLCEVDTMSNFWSFEGEEYLLGYNCRCTIIGMEEDKIVCGPIEYDPEGINEDGPFEEYQITENVEISELGVTSYNSIQDDQEYEEFYEVEFKEMSLEAFKSILESGSGSALLWFDEELKVEKIMFCGRVSVTADYETVTILPEDTETKVPEEYEVSHENWDGSIIYLMDQEQYEKYQNR